ncbi:hypothetical protein B0H10DRAFT_2042883 [Mycena sp. CBHHK59/15]|nr:hypothetical protein B0H10DRAFT_2042883 [Mycena sp. CBHHK59/15]
MRQIFPRGGSRLYAPLHEQTLSGRLSRAAPIPLLPFYSSNIYLGEQPSPRKRYYSEPHTPEYSRTDYLNPRLRSSSHCLFDADLGARFMNSPTLAPQTLHAHPNISCKARRVPTRSAYGANPAWAVRTFSGSVAYCPQSAWIQNTTLVRLCNSRRLTQTDEDVGGCGGPCALRAAVRGGEVLARH